MIVRDRSGAFRKGQRLVQRTRRDAAGRNAHGCAVAVAPVGLWIPFPQPAGEVRTVSALRRGIASAERLHFLHHSRPERQSLPLVFQKRACDGDGHDAVVRDPALRREQGKCLRPDVMELVHRADHVSEDRAVHACRHLLFASFRMRSQRIAVTV